MYSCITKIVVMHRCVLHYTDEKFSVTYDNKSAQNNLGTGPRR